MKICTICSICNWTSKSHFRLILKTVIYVAPVISKITSTGPKKYNISWSKPNLPHGQTIKQYHVTYYASDVTARTESLSKEKTSTYIDVEFDKDYTIEIQVETEAGISKANSKSWISHSGM